MTISIDTNVIVALWWRDHVANSMAAGALRRAQLQGKLIVCAPVFAELMSDPRRTMEELNEFLTDASIVVDWEMREADWLEAGRAYRGYVQRRWSSSGAVPRRILADFMIGAHATRRGYALLTFDSRLYKAAFSKLTLLTS